MIRAILVGDDGLYIVRASGQVERLDPAGPRNFTSHATAVRR